MDKTNLIYNGDFSQGTSHWSGNGLTVSNGEATNTGDLIQTDFIPIANGRRYRLSFDIKFNTAASSKAFYTCIIPYDNTKNAIPVSNVNKPWANTGTTLASQLKNGDTTVSLTSYSNWRQDTYGKLGICDILAWGYNRSSYISPINVSENTVTLKSAWAGGTFAAGTKVAEFRDSNVYYYPWVLSAAATKPTEWESHSIEFNGGNNIRYSCQYIKFMCMAYTHNYSIRNIKLECISDYQECAIQDSVTPQFLKTGIVNGLSFNTNSTLIKYVRDSINGSTVNADNHLCEIQVLNELGENIAWGKDIIVGTTTYTNNKSTEGVVNNTYVNAGSGAKSFLLDLGFLEYVSQIKIWHYYPDGRTYYDNTVEISADGETWYTVYSGEKPETSAGNIISLSSPIMSISDQGQISAYDFIEW